MKKVVIVSVFFLFCIAVAAQTQNFWTKKNDFGGLKRERCVAFSIDNIGYMGMGTDTNEMTHNDWWAYDAVNDLWTQRASLPGSVRRNAVGGAIGSLGYVGLGIDSNEAGPGDPLADFWEYNPATNFWTPKASFPAFGTNGVYFATAFVLDYKFYVVGGKSGPYSLSDEVWEYKPFTNSWNQLANFPGGDRYQMCSFVINNKAYVGLGADHNTYRSEFWEFNPGNGVWTLIADFDGGDRGQATTFSISERGFVCLGTDGGLKSDLWEYNPYMDTWTARASYGGSARDGAAGFVCYGKAYVGTGAGYSGKKASMYEYTPVLILGLDDNTTNNVSIYPNPATDVFVVEGVIDGSVITLNDLQGNTVNRIEVSGSGVQRIDCATLASGVYVLNIISDNGDVVTNKVIVQ